MAMQKPSCKNTPQYLTSCCSLIGQNNTKDFSAQSGGSIGRAVWKWSDESRFPGAFFALLVNIRRFISLPDLFSLAPANRPWVSEDGLRDAAFSFSQKPKPKTIWTCSHIFFCALIMSIYTVKLANAPEKNAEMIQIKTVFSC